MAGVGARNLTTGLPRIAWPARQRAMGAPELFLVSHLRAARAHERLQRAANYLPSKLFARAERELKRAGVSLDISEWFYYRSADLGGLTLNGTEGWVLWRPDTGERLTFLPLSTSASVKNRTTPVVTGKPRNSGLNPQRLNPH